MKKIDVRFVLVDFKSSLKFVKSALFRGGAIKSTKTYQNTDPNTFYSAIKVEQVVFYNITY